MDYVERILESVNQTNSQLISTEEVDPLNLAKSVWQDIYVNTGKDPTKCLYNVVELFIFKFLSDLGVLKTPYNFQFLLDMYKNGSNNKEVLRHYARNSRLEIRKLFPPGEDETTIINGTIFVDSKGNPVESQANLFRNSLMKYNEFGSLKNVKKEFKTKLFETFLKQSPDKSRLGQFFTPRKVVKAIVDMSDVENLKDGSRICDPFCGVGGFILEPLHKTKRKNDFIPSRGKINPNVTYHGFDKGSDEDEERTVILAKANMLIYLSEIVEKNPTLTQEFSKAFNETFHLLTDSNLGTLKITLDNEDAKYDLILTNPPYITSGVTSIRSELKHEGLENYFVSGGKGVEGLALEWIIKALKKEGKAFVIVPDSILTVKQNKGLRDYLLRECFLNCIISLPVKTFFNTPKKTFILGITKKNKITDKQDFPVFTYLVSNIGEELNVNRFEIPGKSDLEKAKDLFNAFKGSPKSFPVDEIGDIRCKLQPIEKFTVSNKWNIDRWWSTEEKISLDIEEEAEILSLDDFIEKIEESKSIFSDSVKNLKGLENKKKVRFTQVRIGDLFDFPETNSGITKKFCNENQGTIPVYASSRNESSVLGYIKDNIKGVKYYQNCLSWNRNGSVGYVFIRTHKFATNEDHRAMILKLDYENILDKEYLKCEIEKVLLLEGFSYLDKCGVSKIKEVIIEIPCDEKNNFDLNAQKYLVARIKGVKGVQKNLEMLKRNIESSKLNIELPGKTVLVPLLKLFDIKSGNSKYTKSYLSKNKGDYPVYSANTKQGGLFGKITTYDYDIECIQLTTNGVYAGTLFYRKKHKFSINGDARLLIKKSDDLDYIYLLYQLRKAFAEQGFNWENKASKSQIMNIEILIPVNDKGDYDLQKQRKISYILNKTDELKRQMLEQLDSITKTEIEIR